MILLHFRVHRAGVNNFARCWRDRRRISFQRHPALRTITRLIRLHAGTHGAKIFCSGRRFYFRIAVTLMFVTAATIAVRFGGHALRQKRFLAMLAAKIKRLSIAVSVESRRFVHRHSANRVFGHSFAFYIKTKGARRTPPQCRRLVLHHAARCRRFRQTLDATGRQYKAQTRA